MVVFSSGLEYFQKISLAVGSYHNSIKGKDDLYIV